MRLENTIVMRVNGRLAHYNNDLVFPHNFARFSVIFIEVIVNC